MEQWQITLFKLFGYGTVDWGQEYLQIKTYRDMLCITLPEKLYVSFWMINKLKHILRGNYYVVIQISDRKQKIKDLIIVRSLLKTAVDTVQFDNHPDTEACRMNQLYPRL